jgi:SulP family sulfate permease
MIAIQKTLKEGYSLAFFKQDVFAGITVAIVALPLGLAIAIASKLSPEKGLYASLIGGLIISLFGGSKFQIGGAAGAFIVLIASIIDRHGYEGLVTATFMAGLLIAIFGLLKLGRFIKQLPETVIAGFSAAIALIIFMSQLKVILGVKQLEFSEINLFSLSLTLDFCCYCKNKRRVCRITFYGQY